MAGLLLILFMVGALSCLLSVLPTRFCLGNVERQTTFFSMLLWALSLILALNFSQEGLMTISHDWLQLGNMPVAIGLAIDHTSITMVVLITTITALVHLYSWGYLEGSPDRPRFFSLISLFCLMILLLVLSSNLLSLFIGWEGVGVASFLLIGFWREKDTARQASLQAFLANRVGDWAFLIALLIIAHDYQQWDWAMLNYAQQEISLLSLALLAFAAITKSAQLPMSFWLPGSMEGPTPISALIHAATMVTAGIYLLIRFEPLLAMHPVIQQALLGASCLTIITMSLRACCHRDIKRVIAYSTMAQLGYMTAGVALLQPELALCHLWTHGFFKALLFLAAGGAIIASGHQQDLHVLAGLLRRQPLLWLCFMIGLLSLIALPPFPGFYSKELLIAQASSAHWSINASLKIGALLTAAYSGRLLGYLWLCPKHHDDKSLKPLPWTMQLSLGLLALLTLLIVPLSLINTPMFQFPWATKMMAANWSQQAFDTSILANLIVFVLSATFVPARLKKHTPSPEKASKELFDVAMQQATHKLFDLVQIARKFSEEFFENAIRYANTWPLMFLSSWPKLLQNMTLRNQIISLFWVISLATVLLEGGKNL